MPTVSPPTSEELVNRLVHITDHLCTNRNDPDGTIREYAVATTNMLRARLADDDQMIARLSAAVTSGQRQVDLRPDERLNRERARADHLTLQLEQLRDKRRRRTWIGKIDLIVLILMLVTPLILGMFIASDIISRRKAEAFLTTVRQRLTGTVPPPPLNSRPPTVRLDNRIIPVRATKGEDGIWRAALELSTPDVVITRQDIYPYIDTSTSIEFPGGEPGAMVDMVEFRTAHDGRLQLVPRMTLMGGVRPGEVRVSIASIRHR